MMQLDWQLVKNLKLKSEVLDKQKGTQKMVSRLYKRQKEDSQRSLTLSSDYVNLQFKQHQTLLGILKENFLIFSSSNSKKKFNVSLPLLSGTHRSPQMLDVTHHMRRNTANCHGQTETSALRETRKRKPVCTKCFQECTICNAPQTGETNQRPTHTNINQCIETNNMLQQYPMTYPNQKENRCTFAHFWIKRNTSESDCYNLGCESSLPWNFGCSRTSPKSHTQIANTHLKQITTRIDEQQKMPIQQRSGELPRCHNSPTITTHMKQQHPPTKHHCTTTKPKTSIAALPQEHPCKNKPLTTNRPTNKLNAFCQHCKHTSWGMGSCKTSDHLIHDNNATFPWPIKQQQMWLCRQSHAILFSHMSRKSWEQKTACLSNNRCKKGTWTLGNWKTPCFKLKGARLTRNANQFGTPTRSQAPKHQGRWS